MKNHFPSSSMWRDYWAINSIYNSEKKSRKGALVVLLFINIVYLTKKSHEKPLPRLQGIFVPLSFDLKELLIWNRFKNIHFLKYYPLSWATINFTIQINKMNSGYTIIKRVAMLRYSIWKDYWLIVYYPCFIMSLMLHFHLLYKSFCKKLIYFIKFHRMSPHFYTFINNSFSSLSVWRIYCIKPGLYQSHQFSSITKPAFAGSVYTTLKCWYRHSCPSYHFQISIMKKYWHVCKSRLGSYCLIPT